MTNTELKPVKNAYVHLVSSQGHRYQYKTDSTGAYRFHFYSESTFTSTVTVASDKWTTSGKLRNLGFLATKDQAVFEMEPGKIYEKNFKLTDIIVCEPFVVLLFETNSIISCNNSLHTLDSVNYKSLDYTLTDLSYILKDDPGMVIELNGHASKLEKEPQQLSLRRAEYIRQLLIEKGINAKRIEIKGFGITKLLIAEAAIKKAQTPEEKLRLHLKNQRVVFRIISWDFKE